jgi:hypothetical protein
VLSRSLDPNPDAAAGDPENIVHALRYHICAKP